MKKTKFLVVLMAVVLMLTGVLSGCSGENSENVSSDLTSTDNVSETLSSDNASTESGNANSSEPLRDPNAPKSLKILSIGHSYSLNATEYLWDIAKAAGVEEVKIGVVYYAGCPLNRHWNNIVNDIPDYVYYKNVAGGWVKYPESTMDVAISDEDWDIVTLQQGPSESGIVSTFENLENIISYVKNQLPEARLFWHLTWANQSDYWSERFEEHYNCDQMTMYNAIMQTYATRVMPITDFEKVIPCGTVVQNLRSSYLGDTLTRDGYHLSDGIGCYAAGLTWYAVLAGGNVDMVDWVPKAFPEIKEDLAVIRQSIKDALEEPLMVTEQTKEK